MALQKAPQRTIAKLREILRALKGLLFRNTPRPASTETFNSGETLEGTEILARFNSRT